MGGDSRILFPVCFQPQDDIELLSSSTADGSLYCQIRRNVRSVINGKTFDLENDRYFLLVAAGSNAGGITTNHNLPIISQY